MTERDKRLQEIRERVYGTSHESKISLVFTAREDLCWLLAEVDRLESITGKPMMDQVLGRASTGGIWIEPRYNVNFEVELEGIEQGTLEDSVE